MDPGELSTREQIDGQMEGTCGGEGFDLIFGIGKNERVKGKKKGSGED